MGCLKLITVVFLTWHKEVLATTTHVGFNEKDCDVYRHYLYTEADKFIVHWNGDPYPKLCTLRFNVMNDDYRLCAHITRFQLDCNNNLKFYWGVSQNIKRYSCHDSLPITYCNDNGLVYMSIEPEYYNIRATSSFLHIEVSPTYMGSNWKSSDSSSSSSSVGVIAGIVIGLVLMFFLIIVCAIRYKRNQDYQGSTYNNARYSHTATQGANVQVALPNSNPQGQYHPVPTQQNLPPGQQYKPFPQAGQQNLYYPPAEQQYPSYPSCGQQFPVTGQQYPTTGQPYPSAPPPGQQFQTSGPYPTGEQFSDNQAPYMQNPSTGGACSPYNTPGHQDSSAPPPSYSTIMGKM